MIISLDTENSTPLHDKSLGESRDTKDIPEHNKGNIHQANIKLNAEKLKAIPLKLQEQKKVVNSLHNYSI